MRRVLSLMMELRQLQLDASTLPNKQKRIDEVGDMFRWIDGELSGIKPTSETDRLAEVMTSADFTYAIQEFVQRQMLPGYQEQTFGFEPFVKPDTLPNYMNVNRYQRRAGLDDLEYVGEKGMARPGSVVDATKRQYRVYRWEKQYDFSMEALVNDDLGYFSDLATDMGRSARRTLEKYVSRMLWNATTTARLVALGALFSTTGRLTTARISTARMAFSQRTDTRGNPIVATLRYIVHHNGLADTVAQIQNSTLVPELATNATNVVRGTFVPINDPHLAGTAPNLPWMALSDYRQNGIVPLVLARLQGRPGPIILRKKSDIETVTALLGAGGMAPPIWGDFDTANIVLKVADVFGTYIDGTEGNMFDHGGLYYSSGTAA
jgi:hypothetical protein